MNSQKIGRTFFYILLGAVALLCLRIFWPFLPVILIGAALAVVLHPLFVWMRDKMFKKHVPWLAAGLTVVIFIIVLGVPLAFIGTKVVVQAKSLYISLADGGSASQYVSQVSDSISTIVPGAAEFDLNSLFHTVLSFLAGNLGSIFSATLNTSLSIFLIILSLFYFLKDGDRWKVYLVAASPLADTHDERILTMLGRAVNGVMKGYILMAFVQGLLLGIGMHIFGVPNAALWGVLAGIASLIPSIGTALVSVPSIVYLYVTGDTAGAIGLAIWAVVLVGSIDNLLNPVVMGKNIELPALVILFAVLGGIAFLGAAGIFIGPLAVSLLYTLMRIYQENFRERQTAL